MPTKKKISKKVVLKKKTATIKTKLLAGGNPQVAKADGDAPVQAYIASVPGWKQDVCRRLDRCITRAVPKVKKAVKWNSPFYGVEEQGWFLNFHCFTKYVKVCFFKGGALKPPPPISGKHKEVRYLHVEEDGLFNEKQFSSWVKKASQIQGWIP